MRHIWQVLRLLLWFRRAERKSRPAPTGRLRHPSYTGAFFGAVSVTIAFSSLIGTALAVVLNIPSYLHRISAEGKAMVADLGEECADYMKEIRGLVEQFVDALKNFEFMKLFEGTEVLGKCPTCGSPVHERLRVGVEQQRV